MAPWLKFLILETIAMIPFMIGFMEIMHHVFPKFGTCLLYTSPSPRDQRGSRMPSSA